MGSRQTIRHQNRFGTELGHFFIEAIEARTNALVVLHILPARENIVIDFVQTLGKPPGLLGKCLAQVIEHSLG